MYKDDCTRRECILSSAFDCVLSVARDTINVSVGILPLTIREVVFASRREELEFRHICPPCTYITQIRYFHHDSFVPVWTMVMAHLHVPCGWPSTDWFIVLLIIRAYTDQ